jgi:urea carboxylase
VRFVPVSDASAAEALAHQDALIAGSPASPPALPADLGDPVLLTLPEQGHRPLVRYRRQGDQHLLVEYGPIVLDLELRLRIHALMLELDALALTGVIEVTPGIRSLQIHFNSRLLPQSVLLDALVSAEERLGGLDEFEIPSRTVYLPLSWNDPAIHETVAKYMASVRDDAPWCPDNIEFIRRVNGLASEDDVQRIVFDAEYLVMGLGDVYLGAPVATPVDPRHRLVTTKYNPARTWTPPNVVGIGGAYMCIYGMEGPGGYQLFGRTIQVWNSWRQTSAFGEGKPWLLRFFDRIRFFPVSADELTEWRRDFPLGRRDIRIDQGTFRLSEYRAFMADNAQSIAAFQQTREAAFASERADWELRGEFSRVAELTSEADAAVSIAEVAVPEGCELVEAPFGGVLWSWAIAEGARVIAGETVAVIEAMKMESPVTSPVSGIVRKLYPAERQPVSPGSPLFAVEVA